MFVVLPIYHHRCFGLGEEVEIVFSLSSSLIYSVLFVVEVAKKLLHG
jgi:hypothetical protein